ncbi:MAG: FIST N-terminal domain-containing protein [Pirellulales bacterium]|nr:FIST N-terminal domain-containing protein [Pirellulales bacterium]
MPPAAFASASSTDPDLSRAISTVAGRLLEQLAQPAHLAMVFATPEYLPFLARVSGEFRRAFPQAVLLGCTAESLVATGKEIESGPALAAWVACLPATRVIPVHWQFTATPDGPRLTAQPPDWLPAQQDGGQLLILGEPYSFPADYLLEHLQKEAPRLPVHGGMASGGQGPGQNRLLFQDEILPSGAVGVWLAGGVRIRSVVSQGCRPIGRPWIITKAERNVIFELGGRPAMLQLREIFESLPEADRELLRSGLHVGLAMSEYRDEFRRGDFLVRGVVGADPKSGMIAIGDDARVGQTMQFHVRDAETASEDLRELLRPIALSAGRNAGALLFTCNGRGQRLFAEPHHDAQALARQWGELPLAGFFAAGEIGPVCGGNYLHGYTASAVLFEALEEASLQPGAK